MLTLVFLVVGALMIAPLLEFMGTGLKSGGVFERKTGELYAGDAGIEDAVWMIKYADRDDATGVFSLTSPANYNEYDYSTAWNYDLDGTVNGKSVSVTIQNEWIPKGIDDIGIIPDPEEAAGVIASKKLRVNGSLSGGSGYRIRIDYDAQPGEELRVQSIGIWLPEGFSYVMGSSNLEDPYQPYHSVPTVTPYAGGEAVIWHFGAFVFGDLPPSRNYREHGGHL